MKTIYLESTINYMLNIGKSPQEINNLVLSGEIKQTEKGIKYLRILEK